jgi:hypothetical protein
MNEPVKYRIKSRSKKLMNFSALICGFQMSFGLVIARAELEIIPGPLPQAVFAGEAQIQVVLRNPGEKLIAIEAHARVFQTTSATAVKLSETSWKKIQVLPGQTINETVRLNFPAVKAEIPFLVQWLEGTNRIFGKTEVLVYPTNLLAELQTLSDEEPLGVFDPNNLLKPLLKICGVEFSDLQENGVADFRGKLAIIGPFQSKAQMPEGLANRIKSAAGKGVAIVWIQPPPTKRDTFSPLFYSVSEGSISIVVAQASLVSDLAENPRSQLNLLHLSRLVLHPEPLRLPQTNQP